MYYDPELPNGFQDADIEMAEAVDKSNRIASYEKKHGCIHVDGGQTLPSGEFKCNCGFMFESDEAFYEHYEQKMGEI